MRWCGGVVLRKRKAGEVRGGGDELSLWDGWMSRRTDGRVWVVCWILGVFSQSLGQVWLCCTAMYWPVLGEEGGWRFLVFGFLGCKGVGLKEGGEKTEERRNGSTRREKVMLQLFNLIKRRSNGSPSSRSPPFSFVRLYVDDLLLCSSLSFVHQARERAPLLFAQLSLSSHTSTHVHVYMLLIQVQVKRRRRIKSRTRLSCITGELRALPIEQRARKQGRKEVRKGDIVAHVFFWVLLRVPVRRVRAGVEVLEEGPARLWNAFGITGKERGV